MCQVVWCVWWWPEGGGDGLEVVGRHFAQREEVMSVCECVCEEVGQRVDVGQWSDILTFSVVLLNPCVALWKSREFGWHC